ncbi:hypothetical protein NSU_0449 [Novosphingobium pentaromativorans US6-1]|uniref:Phytanoyl-CoA dioxygenase n=2 Tax=Novosphingobium pentaromativorans TaxID=205844 RepID=G6E7X8_9SPHN|nr:hypothetical protein NSU_0449 [Novosphingobium pentaromativorans US6-1]
MAPALAVEEALTDLPQPARNLKQCKADLARTGLCIIEDALSPERLKRARDDLYQAAQDDSVIAAQTAGQQDNDRILTADYDSSNLRVWALLNRGQSFIDMAQDPAAIDLVEHTLGPGFLLSNMTANITLPGHAGMKMHADQMSFPLPWPQAALGINIIWLLDDFTSENGATLVVPGSNRLNRWPHYGEDEKHLVPLVGKAGSMVAMDGRVWHQTGANTTLDQSRAGVFAWYSAPAFRTQENWFLSLNPSILQRNPSQALLKMLGYKVKGTAFGHVNGYEPPIR